MPPFPLTLSSRVGFSLREPSFLSLVKKTDSSLTLVMTVFLFAVGQLATSL